MFERAPVQRFDLLDGNPGIDQLTAVGGAQIQLPSPARIGGGDLLPPGPAAQARHHRLIHLVVTRADARADRGPQVLRPALIPVGHHGHRLEADAGRRAAPARVYRGHNAPSGIGQQQRHAVSGMHGQDGPRVRRHQPIRPVDEPARLRPSNHGHHGSMHLGGFDLMRTLQAQRGEDQGAVARHGPWIVLNAAPQVQGRIRTAAVSADARGKRMADAAGPQVVRKEQSRDAHTTRSRTTALR